MEFDHVKADALDHVARVPRNPLVEELGRVDAPDLQLLGDDARRIHILQLEVRVIKGSGVQIVHHVAGQQVGGPRCEVGEQHQLVLFLGHVVLALLVANRLPLLG